MRNLMMGFMASALAVGMSLSADTCGEEPTGSRLKVGAATVTILPEVAGSTSYFDPIRARPTLALEPGDPGDEVGVFVEEWDVGTIPIGNGEGTSHWVHDELRATAVAFQNLDDPDGKTLVLVSVDVYMLLRQDIEEIYTKVRNAVGATEYNKLTILVSASHNHMGPDTLGLEGMNHDYFRYMTDQIAQAVVEATRPEALFPAKLKVAASRYQFGLADSHAPYITDPTLNSLQAITTDEPTERVLATLVQWQSHPEDTLGYGDQILATEEQATYLRSIDECLSNDGGATCHVEGQFMSAGFNGIAMRQIMDATGAPAAYFNGPVGGLLGPLHAYVWETEGPNGQPAGDGLVIPNGAVLIDKNFHKQAVNGNELAKRALSDLQSGEIITDPAITARKQTFYARISNLAFRVGMVVRPNGQPALLGHLKRDLYTCPETGPKDPTTCISDNYEYFLDPILSLPTRVGSHGMTETWYVEIGPISMITVPAETVSELIEGLPSDFLTNTAYLPTAQDQTNHKVGAAYDTAGYARQAMGGNYKWALGLTQDELGYMIPLSDWRVACVADEEALGGTAGTCAALYAAGIIDYQSYNGNNWAISGQRCKALLADPTLVNGPPYTNFQNGGTLAQQSCYYGQLFDEADGHYEETMSGSWDLEGEWMNVVKTLTGFVGELQDINPNFFSQNLRD